MSFLLDQEVIALWSFSALVFLCSIILAISRRHTRPVILSCFFGFLVLAGLELGARLFIIVLFPEKKPGYAIYANRTYPELMAYLASYTEYFGAILLLVGLAVRWISIPLMVTMAVAAVTVHLQHGWSAIAEGTGIFATPRTEGAAERLDKAREILQEYGDYSWLTENGSFVVLNNGIEFAATYFIMLLALLFLGAGKYFSVDYWIARKWRTANSS